MALLSCIGLVIASGSAEKALSCDNSENKPSILVGRVLARVIGLSDYHLVSEGHNVQVFLFGVEAEGKQTEGIIPVKVVYKFFKRQPRLPVKFFDYSLRFKLQVVRDPKCDETVEQLSYMQATDESGRPLEKDYVLRPLKNAPMEIFKTNSLLPCYVLKPGGHSQILMGLHGGFEYVHQAFLGRAREFRKFW